MEGRYLPPLKFSSEAERQAYDRDAMEDMRRRSAMIRASMRGLKPMSEVTEVEIEDAYQEDLNAETEPDGCVLSSEHGGLGFVR